MNSFCSKTWLAVFPLWFVSSVAFCAEATGAPSPFLNFFPKPAEMDQQCKTARDKAEERYKKLEALPDHLRTFENAPRLFEDIGGDLADETASPTFLKYVSQDKEVRDAAHECETTLEQFSVEVYTKEDLYKALAGYKDSGLPRETLTAEERKLLDKILLDFKRNGLVLPKQQREEVKAMKKRLVDLELTFGKNLNEIKDYLPVAREELAGLPEDFIQRLEVLPDGKLKVTLDYPDYFPFMRNAKNADARRRLEEKYNNRAADANVRLLEEAISLRHQIASLLGHPTHAHYVLEDRMAKDPARVSEFLGRLKEKLKKKGEKDLEALVKLKKREEGGKSDGVIHLWDYGYYDNLLRKVKYDLDEEKIKEYFPLDLVTKGMLEIYQKLLSLRFMEVQPANAWHPDVQLFEVYDAEKGNLIGHFYMDLFPREGKYKHAAAFTLIRGKRLQDGAYQKPVSAIVANFNKPTAERPSLLKHSEVETFFHEFGHIMHQVLTRATYGYFSGTNVSRDFVEAPSQMLENWVWEKDILGKLSGHYKDKNKKLPARLLKRMLQVKNLNSGLRYLRQAFFASVDLEYHTTAKVDSTEVYGRAMRQVSLIEMTPGTHPQASFGHLMGGYDAGYYGYLWSEVYAQDMFTRFEKEGILSPTVGKEYRRWILEPGRSLEEADQIRKFLGREPNEEAFLKHIGL